MAPQFYWGAPNQKSVVGEKMSQMLKVDGALRDQECLWSCAVLDVTWYIPAMNGHRSASSHCTGQAAAAQ